MEKDLCNVFVNKRNFGNQGTHRNGLSPEIVACRKFPEMFHEHSSTGGSTMKRLIIAAGLGLGLVGSAIAGPLTQLK